MKTVNPTYDQKLSSQTKYPRTTLEISLDNDDTDLFYITSHADGAYPDGATVILSGIEEGSLSNQTQKLDIAISTSTIGKLSVNLIDVGGALSALIGTKEVAGFGLRHKRIVVHSAFKGDTWDKYEEDATFIIEDMSQDEGLFKLAGTDVHRLTRTKIFAPTVQNLKRTISAGERTLSLAATSFTAATKQITISKTDKLSALNFEPGSELIITDSPLNSGTYTVNTSLSENVLTVLEDLVDETVAAIASHTLNIQLTGTDLTHYQPIEHDANYSVWPSDTVGLVQIDEEVFLHDGPVIHPTLGYVLQVREDGRGVLDTPIQTHEAELGADPSSQPEVTEVVMLEGPAPKLALAVLTGQLYGQTGTLPENMHCGVPAKFIRTADFTNIGKDIWDTTTGEGRHLQFITITEVSGKDWIEKQLMLWIGCFMTIHSDGSLGLKKIPTMNSQTGYVATLDSSVTRKRETLKRPMSKILNSIIIRWGKVTLKDEYSKKNHLVDATSIATHQKGTVKTYTFDGVTTGKNTDEDLRTYLSVWRDLYSSPPYEFTTTVLYKMIKVQVGDAVRVVLPNHRDIVKGTSFDRVMLVTSANYNPMTGEIRLSMIGPSASPTPLLPVSSSVKMDAGYYNPGGTARELGQAIIDGGGSISNGVMTSSATISGSADMNSLDSVFYYNGNFEIPDGVVLSTYDNVYLRIEGFTTINGGIQSIGSSNAGGPGEVGSFTIQSIVGSTITTVEDMTQVNINDLIIVGPLKASTSGQASIVKVASKPTANSITVSYPYGGTLSTVATYVGLAEIYTSPVQKQLQDLLDSRNNVLGVPGFGVNIGEGGFAVVFYTNEVFGYNYQAKTTEPEVSGIGNSTRYLALVNNGTDLSGIPTKFTGSGGTGGRIAGARMYQGTESAAANGGPGGEGGSGILLVCQGASFGVNGFVDLSGEDGTLGGTRTNIYNTGILNFVTLAGGSGMGGSPGAFYIVYDGEYTAPNIEGHVNSQMGVSPVQGIPIIPDLHLANPVPTSAITYRSSQPGSRDYVYTSEDAYFQYLPANLAPTPEAPVYTVVPLSMSLNEVLNSPTSADGNLSTVEITVNAPSDTSYSYANVYYRQLGETQWTFLLPAAGESATVTQVVISNGSTWEYQARPVSISGVESQDGLSQSITVTNIIVEIITTPTLLPLDTPAKLAVVGTAIGQGEYFNENYISPNYFNNFYFSRFVDDPSGVFIGRGCHVVWTYNTAEDVPPQYFSHYRVEIYDYEPTTDVLKRTTEVIEPWFNYTEEMALEDGGPYRYLRFDITAVGRLSGHEGSTASKLFNNEQSGLAQALTVLNLFSASKIDYVPPAVADWVGIKFFVSDTNLFTADDTNLVYSGSETTVYLSHWAAGSVLFPMVPGTTYYMRYQTYDSFGSATGTLSTQFTLNPQQASAASDIADLSAWATELTPVDAAFITANVGDDAISSTQIASLVAGKIATGTLSAELTVSGLITTSATGWRVDIGPVVDGPDTFVLRYHNGSGISNFQVDQLGNVAISGDITVGNPESVRTDLNVADGADVTQAALIVGTTITGGGITLSGGGSLKSTGMTNEDVDVTAGVWLGYNGTDYTFGVGDGADNFVKYDGSEVTIGRDTKLLGTDAYNNTSHYFSTFMHNSAEWNNSGYTFSTYGRATYGITGTGTAFLIYGITDDVDKMNWGRDRRFKARIKQSVLNGTSTIYVSSGYSLSRVGFKISNYSLYGITTSRGGGETSTALLLTLSNQNYYTLECVYHNEDTVYFYVDGVLEGSLTAPSLLISNTASDVSFTAGTNVISSTTIDFTEYYIGNQITITGSASNNISTSIVSIPDANSLVTTSALVTESAGATVTITEENMTDTNTILRFENDVVSSSSNDFEITESKIQIY